MSWGRGRLGEAVVSMLVCGVFVGACGLGARSAPPEPDPVSAVEAERALEVLRVIAAARTSEAMEELCALADDGCIGLSGAVVGEPQSAPGPDVPAPDVLCNLEVGDGARMVVVEGIDGAGDVYVSQMVFTRDDREQVVPLHEPAFWLGIVYRSADVTRNATWTSARHPSPGATDEARAADLLEQARAVC